MEPVSQANERLNRLMAMLSREPDDPFLLYAVGMEHKKAEQSAQALDFFKRVIARDPGYCVAYQQAAQVHEAKGDFELARAAYRDGIAAALRKGDRHAADEMQGALTLLERVARGV